MALSINERCTNCMGQRAPLARRGYVNPSTISRGKADDIVMRLRETISVVAVLLFQAASLSAQPYAREHHVGAFRGTSYSPWNYWTPRLYPVVAHCRGVTAFEEPPGAKYRVHLKRFQNPDFVGYHGAYSGYGRSAVPVIAPPVPAN